MGIFGFFNKEKKETLDKGLEKTLRRCSSLVMWAWIRR